MRRRELTHDIDCCTIEAYSNVEPPVLAGVSTHGKRPDNSII
jgi:hypothetical protein